eukprot:NODE_1068_length_1485_cov_67.516200_g1057_i0.p1 GENE.NODE_1068_length_1485_cov_67.516200_g1057_i0~~NODE_1068_length_1485_cov_67.516200_g1057_i0.p1  ORF type:complete len:438 (-),score=66.37 NODE_1068_length_1485_cov_67.516200_g1057_i0:95-1408(-)
MRQFVGQSHGRSQEDKLVRVVAPQTGASGQVAAVQPPTDMDPDITEYRSMLRDTKLSFHQQRLEAERVLQSRDAEYMELCSKLGDTVRTTETVSRRLDDSARDARSQLAVTMEKQEQVENALRQLEHERQRELEEDERISQVINSKIEMIELQASAAREASLLELRQRAVALTRAQQQLQNDKAALLNERDRVKSATVAAEADLDAKEKQLRVYADTNKRHRHETQRRREAVSRFEEESNRLEVELHTERRALTSRTTRAASMELYAGQSQSSQSQSGWDDAYVDRRPPRSARVQMEPQLADRRDRVISPPRFAPDSPGPVRGRGGGRVTSPMQRFASPELRLASRDIVHHHGPGAFSPVMRRGVASPPPRASPRSGGGGDRIVHHYHHPPPRSAPAGPDYGAEDELLAVRHDGAFVPNSPTSPYIVERGTPIMMES